MPGSHMESQPTIVERYTKSGRHLIYRLNVLQEPERARACGSGPKSTTDRRPVDPPPVVELRIFEGPSIDQAKDITFNYNANFFLFATLEHARPIAQGRVQTPAATTPPVLTGMFVSGMAYLDRPAEAGYFLFPDLSVRHEGRYKLLFNLYEETKEDKDRDADPADSKGAVPPQFEDSFDWRMEVQSRPFTVYSAKKFPGLTESTSLSRTISEQGCRVRIRRDVRMRRREGKSSSNKEYESREEEYARPRRTQTPELKQDHYRPRSVSNSSNDRAPYHQDPQRRPSVADYPAPPPPPTYGPAPPTPGSSGGGYLHFGHSQTTPYAPQHQYPPPPPPPPPQQPQSSPVVPQQPYSQTPRSYTQPAPPPHTPAPYRAPQQSPYSYSERPPSQPYQSDYPPPPRDQYEDSRRSSYPAPPPAPSAYPEPPRDQYPGRVPTPSRVLNIPPLKSIAPLEPRASPAPHTRFQLPPLMNSIHSMISPRDLPTSNKRPFNMAFNDSAHTQPLSNGRRQIDPHHRSLPRGPLSHYPTEDPIGNDPDHVQYRRANGDMQIKPLPTCL